ncbi:hypothetical protein BDD43_2663 [Mucilaginibacter gracilis]|uniref:Uncharacterized protein n=1 Tax=Mucilaginibacter gracilis TaxID=423350 RepID=A0A495J0I5_9SPHI|nr:hypothetical protein [Mucilaginibacter gracilis]RKR82480.1 hypothetical protein BDD43_2663 [Mucilaginibacter gracilis]
MTFQEFFKKKKINLDLLKAAEPALFAEFELHYGQMGEKSFDHTKKYWFNTLRRKYHSPDEPKVDKVPIENRLAEQTVVEAITDEPQTVAAPKLGFKPKFKTGASAPENVPPVAEEITGQESGAEAAAPKLGFKPKFKSAASALQNEPPVAQEITGPASGTEPAAPKLGFKPKFKSATPAQTTPVEPLTTPESNTEPPASTVALPPKLGFKPKFKPSSPPASQQPSANGATNPNPPDADTPSE